MIEREINVSMCRCTYNGTHGQKLYYLMIEREINVFMCRCTYNGTHGEKLYYLMIERERPMFSCVGVHIMEHMAINYIT